MKHRDILDRVFRLKGTFAQQFNHYKRTHQPAAGALIELVTFIMRVLEQYQPYFEMGQFPPNLIFINEMGKVKLKEEWPDIWAEFSFG